LRQVVGRELRQGLLGVGERHLREEVPDPVVHIARPDLLVANQFSDQAVERRVFSATSQLRAGSLDALAVLQRMVREELRYVAAPGKQPVDEGVGGTRAPHSPGPHSWVHTLRIPIKKADLFLTWATS